MTEKLLDSIILDPLGALSRLEIEDPISRTKSPVVVKLPPKAQSDTNKPKVTPKVSRLTRSVVSGRSKPRPSSVQTSSRVLFRKRAEKPSVIKDDKAEGSKKKGKEKEEPIKKEVGSDSSTIDLNMFVEFCEEQFETFRDEIDELTRKIEWLEVNSLKHAPVGGTAPVEIVSRPGNPVTRPDITRPILTTSTASLASVLHTHPEPLNAEAARSLLSTTVSRFGIPGFSSEDVKKVASSYFDDLMEAWDSTSEKEEVINSMINSL